MLFFRIGKICAYPRRKTGEIVNGTKHENIQNLDIPLRTRLLSEGFIDVTGLREYLFGLIPLRKVGANVLASHIKSYAVLGMPPGSNWLNYKGPVPKQDDLYLVIVDENGRVLISKRHVKNNGKVIDLADLDVRLTEYANRTHTNWDVVRPHRLRPCDIFSRFAAPLPGPDDRP